MFALNSVNTLFVGFIYREFLRHVENLARIIGDSRTNNLFDNAVKIHSIIETIVQDSKACRIIRNKMHGFRREKELHELYDVLYRSVGCIQHCSQLKINPIDSVRAAVSFLSKNLSDSVKLCTAGIVDVKLTAHISNILIEFLKLCIIKLSQFQRIAGTEPLRKVFWLVE